MDFRIGYLDSGIGGINYLEALNTRLLANEARDDQSLQYKLYYLADTAAFPYGNKSEEYLVQRISKLVQDFIKKYGLDMVVLACNTASLLCVDSLRAQFTQKIVGIVPAIKPAVELSVPKIYVMNTNTAGNSYYAKDMAEHSKEKYGNESKVFLRACQDLVDAIELMVCSDQEAYHAYAVAELSKIIEEIVELDCQAVVLGCTHFLHIKRELQSLLPDTHIIDSMDGVSKRTLHLVQEIATEKLAASPAPTESATEHSVAHSVEKLAANSAPTESATEHSVAHSVEKLAASPAPTETATEHSIAHSVEKLAASPAPTESATEHSVAHSVEKLAASPAPTETATEHSIAHSVEKLAASPAPTETATEHSIAHSVEKLAASPAPTETATERIFQSTCDSHIEKYFLLTDESKKERYIYVSKIYNMDYLGLL